MGGQLTTCSLALMCLVRVDERGRPVHALPPPNPFNPARRFLDQRFVTDCYLAGRWLYPDAYEIKPTGPIPSETDVGGAPGDAEDDVPLVKSASSTPARDHRVTTDDTLKSKASSKRPRDGGDDSSNHPTSSRVRH